MPKPPEVASELDEMKMNQRDKDVILSNNRIKSGLILNLSCVSGSVLDSMLLMDPSKNLFQQTAGVLNRNQSSRGFVAKLRRQSARQADIEFHQPKSFVCIGAEQYCASSPSCPARM
jgi:hypothetical protein